MYFGILFRINITFVISNSYFKYLLVCKAQPDLKICPFSQGRGSVLRMGGGGGGGCKSKENVKISGALRAQIAI